MRGAQDHSSLVVHLLCNQDERHYSMERFFVGLHQPSDAGHFDYSMVSYNRLENRRSNFPAKSWILDSGAFTRITSGKGHATVSDYRGAISRWSVCGNLVAAVAQDYMCEPFVLAKTGCSVGDHIQQTVERYVDLVAQPTRAYIMPVIQGYAAEDYLKCIEAYGPLLAHGAWVGVGSVCKRNSKPEQINMLLGAIKGARPDLKLHGFGLKITTLRCPDTRSLFYSSDSMAWSYEARRNGGDQNSWRSAKSYEGKVQRLLNR